MGTSLGYQDGVLFDDLFREGDNPIAVIDILNDVLIITKPVRGAAFPVTVPLVRVAFVVFNGVVVSENVLAPASKTA